MRRVRVSTKKLICELPPSDLSAVFQVQCHCGENTGQKFIGFHLFYNLPATFINNLYDWKGEILHKGEGEKRRANDFV